MGALCPLPEPSCTSPRTQPRLQEQAVSLAGLQGTAYEHSAERSAPSSLHCPADPGTIHLSLGPLERVKRDSPDLLAVIQGCSGGGCVRARSEISTAAGTDPAGRGQNLRVLDSLNTSVKIWTAHSRQHAQTYSSLLLTGSKLASLSNFCWLSRRSPLTPG